MLKELTITIAEKNNVKIAKAIGQCQQVTVGARLYRGQFIDVSTITQVTQGSAVAQW